MRTEDSTRTPGVPLDGESVTYQMEVLGQSRSLPDVPSWRRGTGDGRIPTWGRGWTGKRQAGPQRPKWGSRPEGFGDTGVGKSHRRVTTPRDPSLSGPDRHGRKYSPGRNAALEPPNCPTRGSPARKWLARLRLPQGLGAVLPTAPRTPCNSAAGSPFGLQFPASLAAPFWSSAYLPKAVRGFLLCAGSGRGRAVTPFAAAARCHGAGRLKGGVAVFGLSASVGL